MLQGKTKYIFISGSSEDRFINDIAFGLLVLRRRGVNDDDIKIFIDGEPNLIAINFEEDWPVSKIQPLSSIAQELSSYESENVILFTTGHGHELGLDGEYSIRPSELINSIRSIKGLQKGILVISQCYAGAFNYMNAREDGQPELCIIGATGFWPSFSINVGDDMYKELGLSPKFKNWKANVFMLSFLTWIGNPIDIDGDGNYTVMDAYKFASMRTNQVLNIVKQWYAYRSTNQAITLFHKVGENKLSQEQFNLEMRVIVNLNEILHTTQEPFILNARFAQTIEF